METAINPWYDAKQGVRSFSPEKFRYEKKPVCEHRGVTVHRVTRNEFHYVAGGMVITMRGGISREVIDAILEGRGAANVMFWVCDKVAAHLRSLGFTPVGYSDTEGKA